MTWLVFAVSGLLVLAGAASVISGAPIIQIERGWAEVIAGAVAVSGGGVTFALGVAILRLQAIHGAVMAPALRATPDALAAESVAIPFDLRPTVEPLPSEAAPLSGQEPEAEPEAPPAPAAETRHGLWKRVRRPADAETRDEPMLALDPRRDIDPPVAAPVFSSGRSDERPDPAATPFTAAIVSIGEPAPGFDVPAPIVSAEKDGAPRPVEPGIDAEAAAPNRWLRPARFRSRPSVPASEPVVVAPRLDADFDAAPAGDGIPHAGEAPAAGHPGLAAPASSEVAASSLAADPAAPTVVGRYQAGVASYVMYSDGTIHVETEGGEVHRFNSMDELKAFIARQETSVF